MINIFQYLAKPHPTVQQRSVPKEAAAAINRVMNRAASARVDPRQHRRTKLVVVLRLVQMAKCLTVAR